MSLLVVFPWLLNVPSKGLLVHGKCNLVDACKLVEYCEEALKQTFHAIVVFFPNLTHQEVAEIFK